MANEIEKSVALNLYKTIFGALTGGEEGIPAFNPSTTYLTMEPAGRVIRPQDFLNPWSTGNPNGSQAAALNTATLVDEIVDTSPVHARNGRKLSQIYGQVVSGANVQPPPPNPELEAQMTAAKAKLYREVEVPDPDTGEIKKKTVETDLTRDYKKNLVAWQNARAAYMVAYLNSRKSPETIATWPLLGPTLSGPVQIAFNDWQAGGAEAYEDAIATLALCSQNQIGQAFLDAKGLFLSYGLDFEANPNPASNTRRSVIYPSDWSSTEAGSGWPSLEVTHQEQNFSHTSEATAYSGGASVSFGLWNFGGDVSHSDEHQHTHTDATDINIKFKWAVCTISRPWFDAGLLELPHWSMGQLYPPGKLSSGERQQAGTVLPLIPLAFLAIRDLEITANWGSSDADHLASATSGSARVGYGPFSVSGSYSNSSSTDTFHAVRDGNILRMPQLQIIGWINRIVGFCPPNLG